MGTRDEAAEKFEEWRACRSVLDRQTRVLQNQMDSFLAGKGAMPSDLLDEVLELQKKCVALFKQLVKTMGP